MLAAVALMVSVVAAFATREVFDADRFAARTEQALHTEAVNVITRRVCSPNGRRVVRNCLRASGPRPEA